MTKRLLTFLLTLVTCVVWLVPSVSPGGGVANAQTLANGFVVSGDFKGAGYSQIASLYDSGDNLGALGRSLGLERALFAQKIRCALLAPGVGKQAHDAQYGLGTFECGARFGEGAAIVRLGGVGFAERPVHIARFCFSGGNILGLGQVAGDECQRF